ncbi:hypothetical protein [Corallococcus sp. 4LFB]|uniref:hypothetical protein n=1 Tax=Corallococcus sp. 4LFB TaxID=3383249 RepID=UPI003975B6C6
MRRAWWGLLLAWVSVSSARAEEVLVFAAASTTEALQALAPAGLAALAALEVGSAA